MEKLKCVSTEDSEWFTEGKVYEGFGFDTEGGKVLDNKGDWYYVEPGPVGWAVCGYDVTFVEVGDE